MKKNYMRFGVAFIAMCQLSSVALAQETASAPSAAPTTIVTTPTSPALPEAKKVATLSSELNLFMEVFLVQLKAKAYEKAYETTSMDFKKNMSLADFTKFANASRLIDSTSKMWTDKQWDAKTGLIQLQGEFTTDEKETHLVTFEMMKKGDTYEILGITETLSVQLLASMFPKDAALQALVAKDLAAIAKMSKGANFRKFYLSMSKKARKSIKYTTFNKAMRSFKKEKKDISFPANTVITFAEGSPLINKDSGDITVNGEYTNATYAVPFTLGYNYEWEWKLNSLNLSPSLIGAAK